MSTDVYEIKIKGHLDACRLKMYENFTFKHTPAGQTVLTGPIQDQAALFGLLNRLRDLGVPLLSVNRIESENDLSDLKKEWS